MSKRVRISLAVLILATVGGIAALEAAPAPSEPVPVVVQNTPLAVIPAERAGLVVQGTVAAGQSGSWTVGLAPNTKVNLGPRPIFRGRLWYYEPALTNTTSDLLVIDRVSGTADESEPYFKFMVSAAGQGIVDIVEVPGSPGTSSSLPRVHAMTQIYLQPGESITVEGNREAYISGHYEP